MDEIPQGPGQGLSAQIPTLTVVLVVFMAVATAVMVKPAISESVDQPTRGEAFASRARAPLPTVEVPQLSRAVRPVAGPGAAS